MARRFLSVFLAVIFLLLFPLPSPEPPVSGLFVAFIDVGQGDCTIITCGGKTIVIDAGPADSLNTILAELTAIEAGEIDLFAVSHPHADHIGGMAGLIEIFRPESILLPPIEKTTKVYGRMAEAIYEYDVQEIFPAPGDTVMLGDAQITVYAPNPVTYQDENDWSLVLMLEYEGVRFLFTGDAGYESEQDMVLFADTLPLCADVLKVGHHGSYSSSSYTFIEAVSPQYAVISCGKVNIYGYPHVETAMTLFDCGVHDIFVMSQTGTVRMRVTNGSLHVLP